MAGNQQHSGNAPERPANAAESSTPPTTDSQRWFARKYRPWLLAGTASSALVALAIAVSAWPWFRAEQAHPFVTEAEPNRAIVAEKVAKEQTDRALQRKSLSLLGPLVDPDKDCQLVKDEASCKIKIEVPGNKLHTLAPEVVTLLDKKKPLHNAPMTLTDVEGDFVASVEVTGEISTGSILPQNLHGNSIPFTFQGAGLLLYQDQDNFVRLERTAGTAIGTLARIHKVLLEVVKDGKNMNQSYPPEPEGPVYLLLMRHKGRTVWGASSSIRGLATPFKEIATEEIEIDLPPKVKIGLSASNISAKPFTATFENFALITDVAVIDAHFGYSSK